MINRFAYRLPDDDTVHRGSSSVLYRGIGKDGFVVAPFENPREGCFTIPAHHVPDGEVYEPEEYRCDFNSTSREAHSAGVRAILDKISTGELDKCVLAKVIVGKGEVDPMESFRSLCESRRDAFVFYFETQATGAWIGASPELLLRVRDGRISTMSLAGTRIADSREEWNNKEINEQRIVTEFIADMLRCHGMEPELAGPVNAKAGNVEHLRTDISAQLPSKWSGMHELENLLYNLSPTPALCGFPRDEAMATLHDVEQFRRGYYGGFCGPVSDGGSLLQMYVNLRSCCIRNARYTIYAGGGIVAGSQTGAEWMETEKKALTIRDNLIIKNDKE